jgi:outer membrane protein assembly factor BamE (lipoprotein component of BamABCDE complex)
MKTKRALLAAWIAILGLYLLAACASNPKHAYTTVVEGMSRNNLRYYFGEPLRIVPTASGGEDWYYRFASWKTKPTGTAATHEEYGAPTTYVSTGMDFWREVVELPVHLSPEGFVVAPVPKGKVDR